MTLSQAWQAFKDSMYAFWIYREPEPFSYIRDVDELTAFASTELDQDGVFAQSSKNPLTLLKPEQPNTMNTFYSIGRLLILNIDIPNDVTEVGLKALGVKGKAKRLFWRFYWIID